MAVVAVVGVVVAVVGVFFLWFWVASCETAFGLHLYSIFTATFPKLGFA